MRESPSHVLFFSRITSKWGRLVCNCGCNLLQKKMLCFVVITDGFRNINPHLEAKQATTVFARKIKEKHMKEMRRILLWKTDKLWITWATPVFYCTTLGLSWAKRLTWTTKIFNGQPNQVLWLPQGQLDIKINFKPWGCQTDKKIEGYVVLKLKIRVLIKKINK